MDDIKYILLFLSLFFRCKSVLAQFYPFMASVYNNQDIVCGSVVIHKNYLLTVASCIQKNENQKYYVLFGDPKKKRKSCVDKVIYFPNYVAKYHKNDLALLHLTEPLPLTDDRMNVKRITLTQDSDFNDCFTISMSNNLQQQAGLIIWSRRAINAPHPKYNDFSIEISPFYDNETTIPILKGSPMICNGRAVGLFSDVIRPLKSGRILAAYTQIPIYIDWIEKYVGNSTFIGTFDTIVQKIPSDLDQVSSLYMDSEEKPTDKIESHLIFIIFIILIRYLSQFK